MEVVITSEQVEKMQDALHDTYEKRYMGSEYDEYLRGYGTALKDVLNLMGIEHEKWNPLGIYEAQREGRK